jgi:hypothetical protein
LTIGTIMTLSHAVVSNCKITRIIIFTFEVKS